MATPRGLARFGATMDSFHAGSRVWRRFGHKFFAFLWINRLLAPIFFFGTRLPELYFDAHRGNSLRLSLGCPITRIRPERRLLGRPTYPDEITVRHWRLLHVMREIRKAQKLRGVSFLVFQVSEIQQGKKSGLRGLPESFSHKESRAALGNTHTVGHVAPLQKRDRVIQSAEENCLRPPT